MAKDGISIGFLTVIESTTHGLFGGYLIVNAFGRPLEFHCTAPVRPNRAQEILYGPTLKPFLYGEQIGLTLIEKAKVRPAVILTDLEEVMSVRPLLKQPVVWLPSEEEEVPQRSTRYNVLSCFDLPLYVRTSHADDQSTAKLPLESYGENLDLREPFGRIREAIEEAQSSSRAA